MWEIQRSIEYQKNKFIIVDAYRNDDENVCMEFDCKNNYAC